MRKPILIAALVAAIAVPLAAPSTAKTPPSRLVRVDDNFFSPKVVGVKVRQVVRFKWVGEDLHNVVGRGKDSELQDEGTFKKRFKTAGKYKYICDLHPEMTVKIKVAE